MLFWVLLLGAMGMVLAQDVYPGQAVYHYGWYNALAIALFVIACMRARRGLLLALFGAAIVLFAGVASGLMGPDTQLIVGAPGASVRSQDVGGTFAFPLANAAQAVQLQRGNSSIAIGPGRRYTGGFVLWLQPRTVVFVNAADAQGNHLTITQPTNASFLSPVLLMQQSTTIAGLNVQYDTFSVPAVRRSVKAVLFTEQQAAQLHGSGAQPGKPAVLFAVSDNADRVIPGGIGLVADGDRKTIGGLQLGATAGTYPAVVAASAPFLPVLLAGLALFVVGAFLAKRGSPPLGGPQPA